MENHCASFRTKLFNEETASSKLYIHSATFEHELKRSMAKWLAFPTSDHEVPGSNHTWGRIQLISL